MIRCWSIPKVPIFIVRSHLPSSADGPYMSDTAISFNRRYIGKAGTPMVDQMVDRLADHVHFGRLHDRPDHRAAAPTLADEQHRPQFSGCAKAIGEPVIEKFDQFGSRFWISLFVAFREMPVRRRRCMNAIQPNISATSTASRFIVNDRFITAAKSKSSAGIRKRISSCEADGFLLQFFIKASLIAILRLLDLHLSFIGRRAVNRRTGMSFSRK